MTCGKTACPDLCFGESDGSNSAPCVLGVVEETGPPTGPFDRTELQQLRDRARPLSIPGSIRKTTEERLYAQMADIADHLDALAARREQNREAMLKEPAREPCEPGCAVNHGNSSCVGRIGG